MSYLTVRDLSLGYDGTAVAEGISFKADPGDYLCILGENGSGKSTLMKTILQLIRPLSGSVVYGDGLNASMIGYLPQQTEIQRDFPASVREIVLSGCLGRSANRFFYSSEDKKKADKNMKRMQIEDMAGKCYRELSGGQQQRVLLARALCAAEKILVLDEPATGLDSRVSSELYSLIKELNRQKVTIIMITHDTAAALAYASHILLMGDEIWYGTKDDYVKSRLGQYLHETPEVTA